VFKTFEVKSPIQKFRPGLFSDLKCGTGSGKMKETSHCAFRFMKFVYRKL